MKINRELRKDNPAALLLTLLACLYIPLFLLRIARIYEGFAGHFYSISNFRDFLFIVFAFFQDIVFCFVLFLIFRFLLWLPIKEPVRIGIKVFAFIFAYFSMFLTIADLFFFKNFGKPMTWNGIESELAAAGDFADTAFSMFTPYLWFTLFLGLFLIGPGTLLLYFLVTRKKKPEHVKIRVFRLEFIFLIAAIGIFSFSSFFLVPTDDAGQGIRAVPVYQLPMSYFAKRSMNNNPIMDELDEEKAEELFSAKFSRDSRHYSLDPMDRKVQENINATLGKIKDKNFNVVFYLSESTYAGRLGKYGASFDPMPRLTKLSSKSLFLENMYSTSVRSMNSLVSLLTGLGGYPGFSVLTEVNPRIETPAMSQILKEKGYSTALIHSGSFHFYEKLEFLKDRDFDLLVEWNDLYWEYPDTWSFSWGIDDRVMFDKGLKWIDQQVAEDKNFFLTFVPILPHNPYHIPEDAELVIPEAEYTYDRYMNSLNYVDTLFENFYNSLKERGLLENTIIVFLADHGEGFGRLHQGNYGHSNNIWEENIKVPGIIFNPIIFDREYNFSGLVNTSDIFATVLDLLDIENPYGSQGESVLKMSTAKMNFVGTGNYDILVGLRDGEFKAIYNFDRDTIQLYSLTDTIVEKRDIADLNPVLSSEYKQLLKDFYMYQIAYFENFNDITSRLKLNSRGQSAFSLLDLPDSFFAQTNYTYRKNLTAKGNPIIINGVTYEKGIGVYANSVLMYDISGLDAEKLTGYAGKVDLTFDNTDITNARGKTGNPGNVEHYLEMIIKVDGMQKFTTGRITNYQPVIPFSIDIRNASEIEFIVRDAGDGDVDDNCVWIDPQIIRTTRMQPAG